MSFPMKIFISHTWNHDKMTAVRIADALREAGAEIWIDDHKLIAGQAMQERIDAAIAEHDMIVLVWSEHSQKSTAVKAEIDTALRLNKVIVPFRLDGTPIFEPLETIKYINATDIDEAIGRLKMVMLNYMASGMNMQGTDAVQQMNAFMGSLEIADHLVRMEHIKENGTEEEKDFWVEHIRKTEVEAEKQMRAEQEIGLEVQEFLNHKMAELGAALQDRVACGKILEEMHRFKHAQHPAMQMFIQKVQGIVDSFPAEHAPVADPQQAAVRQYRHTIELELEKSRDIVKNVAGRFLPGAMFALLYDKFSYFYLASVRMLEEMCEASQKPGADRSITVTVDFVCEYIRHTEAAPSRNPLGILGYTDEAIVIVLATRKLYGSKLLEPHAGGLDWKKVNGVFETLTGLMGAQFRKHIDELSAAVATVGNAHATAQTSVPDNQADRLAVLQRQKKQLWEAKLTGLRGDLHFGNVPKW